MEILMPQATDPFATAMKVVDDKGYLNALEDARILIIGDLHVSDKPSQRHNDYFNDCIDFCNQITKTIIDKKIKILILTGDLVGRTTEKNFQTREAFVIFMTILQVWNNLTNGQVYSLRGNHDISHKLPDFEVYVKMGVIKVVDEIDLPNIRFHMLNYNEHSREINVDPNKYNVAVMHTELHVEGQTNWIFQSQEGVFLSTLENLYGIDMVIAGHIHNPSVRVTQTSIRDKSIQLFYPGCGTRPKYDKNIWNHVYGVIFEQVNGQVKISNEKYDLKPPEEFFATLITEEELRELILKQTEEEEKEQFDVDSLSTVMEQLTQYNLHGDTDVKQQIEIMGRENPKAVELALKTMEEVESIS